MIKICFLCGEIFGWGKYGGFGFVTRKIGSELVKRGLIVYAIVPLGKSQRLVENLDGIKVFGYPGGDWKKLVEILKECDADIYHSEEPNYATYLAQKIHPEKKHVITFQDPRNLKDWTIEFVYSDFSKKRAFPGMLFFEWAYNPFIRIAVKRADALFCQAKYVILKCKKLYGLKKNPQFLPNPVDIPEKEIRKAEEPTVLYLGRWDKRKRPEYFIELAKYFPEVNFLMAGNPEATIIKKYNNLPSNIKILGLLYGEKKKEILEKSWILVNPAIRECLPVAYLEALSYKCAILSYTNPDGFASNFGYWVKKGGPSDFIRGLKSLLENDDWKKKGEAGYKYVKTVHETKKVIDQHIKIYRELL
jgi:glycosyltransferase involved in cell wall biosynthesis